ncbi:MAG: Ldh family oxidoreductase [Anaerolineales bacterium]|nr:Ldh family oxidoreductase [Anaerolineales bacterium]
MSEQSVKVPVNTLVDFMLEALVAMGTSLEDARIIADVIITSDLWGIRSHGIAHLKMYHERIKKGLQLPTTLITLVKDTPTTAVLDGGNGMGMVVGHHAMKMAIEKARQYGLGAVAVRNSSHYGVAGYYPLMAVKEGMVGLSVTNAHPSIAPTFGVRPMLGTNPIAVAAPTDDPFPYMFDAATSVAPRGKIEIAKRANKPIPEGWVINQDGISATDPTDMIKEMDLGNMALLPVGGMGELMGGHKGYGLATMVEIFSAAFQDGTYLWGLTDTDADGNPQFLRIGHFFLAIDIEHFIPLHTFKKITGDMMRELRNSTVSPGQTRIYTAGEKEYYSAQRVQAEGVEIPPGVQKALQTLQQELKLSNTQLGF